MLLNAPLPTSNLVASVASIFTFVRLAHPTNASLPIFVIVLGIVIVFKLEQDKNILAAISVIFQFNIADTSSSFLQLLNILFILVTFFTFQFDIADRFINAHPALSPSPNILDISVTLDVFHFFKPSISVSSLFPANMLLISLTLEVSQFNNAFTFDKLFVKDHL
ncbi:unknown [Clostridium sp. CAG:508]|nr:unknown [Clostridium sp. CAG:508]